MANQVFVLVAVWLIVAGALAQNAELLSESQPKVIREKNNNDGSGNYAFSYELDNGQQFSEQGELKTFGDQQAVVKTGSYSFVAPDGVTYWVTYTADENGFHPIVGSGPGGPRDTNEVESFKSFSG